MPEVWTHFAQVLRELREARGLSQDQLAEKAGVHRTHVSLIERGERCPSLKVADHLAAALGMSLSDMVAVAELRRKTAPKTRRGTV